MRVHAVPRDFGRCLDLYFITDGQPERQLIFVGPGEDGDYEFREEVLQQGVRISTPSLSLDPRWVGPLVDALTEHVPTKIDQTVLDRLDIETKRVDKLLDHVISLVPASEV